MRNCFILSFIIFALTAGGYIITTVATLHELDAKSNTSVESTYINIDEPLHSTKYIDALDSPSLRQKAATQRQAYNRTYQVCRAVRERVEFYRSKGTLSKETEQMVEKKLQELEKQNEYTKKKYEALDAYAQTFYEKTL